jgi:RNA polymerase sigma factor (sigma-70 family)
MAKAGSGKKRPQQEVWVVDEQTEAWFRAQDKEIQGLGEPDNHIACPAANLLLVRLRDKQSKLDAMSAEEQHKYLKGGLRRNKQQIRRDEQRHHRNRIDPAEIQTQARDGMPRYEWQTIDYLRGVEHVPSPAREVESRDVLNKSLATLNPHQRGVFERRLAGLTLQAIADELHTSVNNIAEIEKQALTKVRRFNRLE